MNPAPTRNQPPKTTWSVVGRLNYFLGQRELTNRVTECYSTYWGCELNMDVNNGQKHGAGSRRNYVLHSVTRCNIVVKGFTRTWKDSLCVLK